MKHLYFDYNSTSPVMPEVVEAVTDCMSSTYGNPSSIHSFGQDAAMLVDEARLHVANLIGAQVDEIVFTSGGTESNNYALSGLKAQFNKGKNHIITCSTEHSSVYNHCEVMQKEGIDVTFLKVDKQGRISLEELEASITDKTSLISIMIANNETGVIQDIVAVSEIATKYRLPFHTDAVQAIGKFPVDVDDLGVDMLSLSGHKFGAPKGIGALYVRRGLKLAPYIHGGGQESRRRSGTENVPGIVGLGKAAEITARDLEKNIANLTILRDRLEAGLLERNPEAKVNGDREHRVCNTLNICFPGLESDTLIVQMDLEGIAASTGSACGSYHREASRVLRAMGIPAIDYYSAIRLSLGPQCTEQMIDRAVEAISNIVSKF